MARNQKPDPFGTEPLAAPGQWIQRRRRHLGLTQKALAHRAQCSVAWIKQIEQARHPPGAELATALAAALEIPPHLSPAFIRALRTGDFSAQPLPETLDNISPPPAVPPLPLQPTRFLGRTGELGQIARALQDPDCRMLTLLGPGGIGKTRLALHAAEQHRAAFDAVYFVSLREVDAGDRVARAVADALLLPRLPSDPVLQVAAYLREMHPKTLLVLDNFEHVLDGAETVDALLEHAPALKVLVTSRERLRSLRETALEILGLDYPAAHDAADPLEFTAVQLFLERARRALPRFPLSELGDAARICRFVQGHPLAIELAAAWAASFSCGEMAERIAHNIELLEKQRHDSGDAHRSVAAAFDSSFALLTAAEQETFSALGIFEGGFDPDAAAHIAGAERRRLADLADKSLVQREGRRFVLHELLRHYAAEKLSAGRERANETGARLFHYYLDYARRHAADFARLESEWTNFNTALRVARAQAEWEIVAGLVQLLREPWETRGRFEDARHALAWACEAAEARGDSMAYAHALRDWGRACIEQGAYAEAEKHLTASLQGCERIGDRAGMADAQADMARIATERSDFEAALRWLHASREIRAALHAEPAIVETLFAEARTHYYLGAYTLAAGLAHEVLTAQERFGDEKGRLRTLHLLGVIALHQSDGAPAAEQYCTGALELAERLNDRGELSAVLMTLAEVLRRKGDPEQARVHAETSLALLRAMGDQQSQARGLYRLSLIFLDLHNDRAAGQAARESLALCRELGDVRGMVYLLTQLGTLEQNRKDDERARALWTEAYALAQTLVPPHPLVGTLQENLGQGQYVIGPSVVQPPAHKTAT